MITFHIKINKIFQNIKTVQRDKMKICVVAVDTVTNMGFVDIWLLKSGCLN